MSKSNKERACNIILRALLVADNCTMSRDAIVTLLSTTRYASTALTHCIAYCNDMKVYHSAQIEYVKASKTVTHVSLKNVLRFNKETGFALTDDEIAARNAAIVALAESFALDNEVTMCEDSFSLDTRVDMLMITDDSDSHRHAVRAAAVMSRAASV